MNMETRRKKSNACSTQYKTVMARTITTPYLHRIVFLVLFLLVWLGGNLQWCILGVAGGTGREERGKIERDGRWGKMKGKMGSRRKR